MALKAMIGKDEFGKLPKELQSEYKQDGDNFILDVDEKGYKDRLNEFRENNTKLTKKEQDLLEQLKKFDGINPEDYKDLTTLRDKINAMEESDMIKQGKLDDVIQRRTAKLTQGFEQDKAKWMEVEGSLKKRLDAQTSKLRNLMIRDQIIGEVRKVANIRKNADLDIARRATDTWHLDDNDRLVPKDPDGKTITGKSGTTPISPAEWAKELVSEAPYLFETGGGSGASGGQPGQGTVTGQTLRIPQGAPIPGEHMADIASGKLTVVRE